MNILTIIFGSLGGVAALVAIIWFISREMVKMLLAKDLQAHKAKLDIDNAKEMETLKVRNETIFSEFKEKLTHLSKRRIDAIENVSQRIIAAWAALVRQSAHMKWADPNKPRHEEAREEWAALLQTSNDLLSYFLSVEIFFPKKLSDKILEFRRQISILIDVYGPQLARPHIEQVYLMKCMDDIRKKKDEMEPIYEGVRDELRKLLGVE